MSATLLAKGQLPRRTTAQLRASIYHITYENEALSRAANRFRHTEGRFALEAALVHARNLIDFFWTPTNKRRAHSDGVYAAHFLKPGVWKKQLAAATVKPSQLYDPLSAQLVHISVKRSQRDVLVAFSIEEVDRLGADLGSVWKLFLQTLVGTRWLRPIRRRAAKWRHAE